VDTSARERRFLELVNANDRRLRRIARGYAGGDWPDLHQEILLQVWRGLDSFAGRASASTWLYRVALNTALTWRRRAIPAARVISARETVPEPVGIDRAILLLYLEDASYAEIAEVTGLTQGNVGVRLNRLKRAFIDRYIGD
jgi:RNA polymerase sigma-70 factor (ECF subfamily)